MDNITHTVIGCIAGETLARVLPATPLRRRMLPLIGMIGGNLPDLDLLYSYTGGSSGRITYLLQHRGYTHTVIGCLMMAALLFGAIFLYARRSGNRMDRREQVLFFSWSVLATLLHLVMDSLNSYGVHPFWPFDNHWYYGDSVFIIEPLYWAAAAPLMFVFQSRLARALIGLLLMAGIVASAASSLVPLPCLLVLCVLSLTLLVLGRTVSARRAAAMSAGTFLVVTAAFIAAGQMAHARVRQAAFIDFPAEQLVDVVLSPMPADPLCWDSLVLGVEKGNYHAHRATVALVPGLVPAANCRDRDMQGPSTARWTESPASADALPWREYSMPLEALQQLVRRHCQAAALMQFVRAPFIEQDGDSVILGDLRFDREQGLGLAKLRFPSPVADLCPHAAPWIAPREALLGDP